MLQGPTDADGNRFFPGSTYGTSATGFAALGNTRCDGGKCTGSPMMLATDWIRLLVKKDAAFDVASLSLDEFSRIFRQGGCVYNGMFAADDADLGPFRGRCKKLITWHSINDEAITINTMRQYYEAVTRLDGSRGVDTVSYYRYFEVPGATHCSAPPGVGYPMKALDALRRWVEEGVVPDKLSTTRLGDVAGDQFVCPYPQVPVERGHSTVCAERSEADKANLGKDEL